MPYSLNKHCISHEHVPYKMSRKPNRVLMCGLKPYWVPDAVQLPKKWIDFLSQDFKFWVKAFLPNIVKISPWVPGL